MGFTLTHRFLDMTGQPSEGVVYVGATMSPVLDHSTTFTATGRPSRIDRWGNWIASDLPSGPAGLQLVIIPVLHGIGQIGPVYVPVQADGTTHDLGELIPGWPLGALTGPPPPNLGQLPSAGGSTGTTTTVTTTTGGTATLTTSSSTLLVDNGNGTATLTPDASTTVVDNGDGTATLTLA